MKKAIVIPSLIGLLFTLGDGLLAQDALVKTLEFKNFERPEEEKEDSLNLVKKEYKEFDEDGRMTLFVKYLANPIGEIVKNTEVKKEWDAHFRSEAVAEYDEMGDMLSKETKYYSLKENVLTKTEHIDYLKAPNDPVIKLYTYTASGNPDKITILDKNEKKVGLEQYKYSKDDEEVEYKKSYKRPDGSKYSEVKKTKYTDNGGLAERYIQIKDGKDTYKEEITFERNKIKEHIKYKNGTIISQFGGATAAAAKYDPSKSRVMMDFGSGGGSGDDKKKGSAFGSFGLWASEDEFDDNGNKIRTVQTTDGKITQTTDYKYDDKGNLAETIKISFNEGKETNNEKESFEYDENNKLLKKAIFSNGVLVSEKIYDYTYY